LGIWLRSERGISSLEYAILIAAILAALIAGQIFLRRAISSKWRESIDGAFGEGRQYSTEPGRETTVIKR
jgi:Flp pilus assembly pilin Flp